MAAHGCVGTEARGRWDRTASSPSRRIIWWTTRTPPLEFTDLVFIDPVTTGFSRAAPGEKESQFHGFEGDLESVAEFIRLYLTRSERWGSPKFLAGESYGTTRAAALSQRLLENDGIYLNGITLISTVLNFETISFARGNDLPYALFLPSYTAAAWYHKKLPKDLQGDLEKALGESRRFAGNEYSVALMKGDKLTAAERTNVVHEMARLTGLSEQYIEPVQSACFRRPIHQGTAARSAARPSAGTTAGWKARTSTRPARRPNMIPAMRPCKGVFTAMFNNYVRSELKYDSDVPYQVLTDKVQPWNYDRFQNRYVNVAEMLRAGHDAEPQPEGDDRERLLRSGDAVFRHRIHGQPYRPGAEPEQSHQLDLLRCRPHAVHARRSCLDALHGAMADFYQKALPNGAPTP